MMKNKIICLNEYYNKSDQLIGKKFKIIQLKDKLVKDENIYTMIDFASLYDVEGAYYGQEYFFKDEHGKKRILISENPAFSSVIYRVDLIELINS